MGHAVHVGGIRRSGHEQGFVGRLHGSEDTARVAVRILVGMISQGLLLVGSLDILGPPSVTGTRTRARRPTFFVNPLFNCKHSAGFFAITSRFFSTLVVSCQDRDDGTREEDHGGRQTFIMISPKIWATLGLG
jgi:hypothetical protein